MAFLLKMKNASARCVKKPRELVHQYPFDLVCLLYPDADPDTVDARLY